MTDGSRYINFQIPKLTLRFTLVSELNTSSVPFKSTKRKEPCADHPTPFSARIKYGSPPSVPLSAVSFVQTVKVSLEAQDLLNLHTSGFWQRTL